MAVMSNSAQSDGTKGSLVRILDAADAMPGASALRARSYDLLDVAPGQVVVDVGCGTGLAVAELAGRGAWVVGVDVSEPMITLARRRWPGLDFRLGTAGELPLADGAVAGYRADKVFHELADPALALAEAWRVLVPRGRIVLVGQDWDAFVIDSDDPGLTRTIVHARADMIANPRAARRYRTLLLDAGFQDVTIEVNTAVFTDMTMLPMLTGLADAACASGAISRAQAERWTAEHTQRAQAGRLFVAVPLFLAVGERPD
jgi:SAM-dependent methyltransferase